MNFRIELHLFNIIIYYYDRVNVVQWSEDLYEKQLIERTIDACGGLVDIVIDFGTTSRSLHRSLQCLGKGGVVLVSEEVGEKLLPKFSSLAERREQKIRAVANGSVDQLKELVELVASNEVSQNSSDFLGLCSVSHAIIVVCFFFIVRLNHHHTQCFHAKKPKKLCVNYANQRFRAALF